MLSGVAAASRSTSELTSSYPDAGTPGIDTPRLPCQSRARFGPRPAGPDGRTTRGEYLLMAISSARNQPFGAPFPALFGRPAVW